MFEIRQYTADRAAEWNGFVDRSKNGTFLFDRSYMDYHSDRFTDHSLLFYRRGRLCGLLPANVTADGTLWTHQGLTYGGLVTDSRATVADVLAMVRLLNDTLRREGLRRVVYKAVPWPYHLLPAEEDLFALVSCCGARLVDRSLGSVLVMDRRLPFTESRRSGLRKAARAGLRVRESADFTAFWRVLTANLQECHGARPVHTLEEITLLKSRFPEHIRLFESVSADGRVLGGSVVYCTPQVVKVQYISASAEGKRCGAVDVLFDRLLNEHVSGVRYVDFGTSMEGSRLSDTLAFQKEGFGARAVCYDWYEWTL